MPVNLGPDSVESGSRTQFGALLLRGVSAIALGALGVVGFASPAHAQAAASASTDDTTTDADEDVIVVTGVRQSLRNSQQIKRDADTVVDSITATDIGAFPDKSVAEALQRVAGITVNRFAASDDTAHFSAEPSGVIVRGLPQVRSEFNGRDSFSANSSRGLSWSDISPELMSGVDTYKNQTAELIEGGIAGSINMRTRVPFDAAGQVIAITGRVNYGDISEKFTPELSGIYSNRWMTNAGEFGFMADYAYSYVQTASQGIFFGRMGKFQNYPGATTALQYIPSSMTYRDNTYDRERNGFATALQWQDPDHKFLVTAQFNRSTYENTWHEHTIGSFPADLFYGQDKNFVIDRATNVGAPRPLAGTPDFTFDSNGLFQSGVMTNDVGWWGGDNNAAAGFAAHTNGVNFVNACYTWGGDPSCGTVGGGGRRSPEVGTATRFNHNQNMTQDMSINLKWDATDRLRFNFDIQHVDSTVRNYDIEVDQQSFASVEWNLTGDHPTMTLRDTPVSSSNPNGTTDINLSPGGLSNPDNYYYRAIMDHLEDSEGQEDAARIDMQYSFDTDWLDAIRVGVRYANRDQTVRWSTYNWQNVANNWSCNGVYYPIDQHAPQTLSNPPTPGSPAAACGYTGPSFTFNGYPEDNAVVAPFGNNAFFSGNLSPHQFVFANMDMIEDHERLANALGNQALGFPSSFTGWDPICSNVGDRATELPGTCYRQVEITDITEETKAAYIMLKFGGDNATIGGMRISGNIGVRYVDTINTSQGGVVFPNPLSGAQLTCGPTPVLPPGTPPPAVPPVPGTIGCYISAQDIAFANAAQVVSTAEAEHTNWLPSFNLKLDLTDEWVLRFAASRAMARPDIGYLKNFLSINAASFPSTSSPSDPRWVYGNGTSNPPTGVLPTYTATAFNPYLEPTTADNFDLSLEDYFSDVGSFSIAIFYKKFYNYIQGSSRFDIPVTNNGVTRTVQVNGPVNADGGSIRGAEISYQRFFDFLPGAWSGLGVQANYTYIENEGVNNQHARIVSGDGTATTTNAGNPSLVTVDSLEGMSENSYNLIGMYEHGPWAARLAYNWRSKHLVTAFDCCVYLPVWEDDAGYLDGSIRYRVNDRMEISVEGSNLLNTETVLKQQVQDVENGGLLLPNAWIQQDRRFVAGIRFRF